MHVIYQTLLDSVSQYNVMKKWSIVDARFSSLFVYLLHFYKLKFVGVVTDKAALKFLNAYGSAELYYGECSLLRSFFAFVEKELAPFQKMRNSSEFEPVFYEVVRKVLLLFLVQLLELIKHPKFELKVGQVCLLMNEFAHFDKLAKAFLVRVNKKYGFDRRAFEWCVGLRNLQKLADDSIALLMARLVDHLRPEILAPIKSAKLAELSLDAIMQRVAAKQAEIGQVDAALLGKFETRKYDVCLEELTKRLTLKTESDVETQLQRLCDNFVAHMRGVAAAPLDDHILYIEQLTAFFVSTTFLKCQASLSIIQKLLSFKLSKKTLLELIRRKRNAKGATQDELTDAINHHFERFKQFADLQAFHKKATKKLVTFVYTLIFVMRFKTASRRKRSIGKTPQAAAAGVKFANEPIADECLNVKGSAPVRFQLLLNHALRTKFKNYSMADMWANQHTDADDAQGGAARGRRAHPAAGDRGDADQLLLGVEDQ